MPEPSANELRELIDEFRKELRDVEELYRDSAIECVRYHPDLIKDSATDFVERMTDLHRGLLIKIFVDIAHIDWKWKPSERMLAQVLFEHVWGRRLDGDQLKDALGKIIEQRDLKWSALLSPFERLAPLRNRVGQLQTLVMRIANLVAKVDGEVQPQEVNQLEAIRCDLARVLERVPLDEPSQHGAAHDSAKQALQTMYTEAAEVRARCELKGQEGQKGSKGQKVEQKSPEQLLADVLAELDELIGLDSIKQEVHGLTNLLKMQQERAKLGLAQTKVSLHMVFNGNPGTGKTTVARLIGRILGSMRILTKGHLVETDRSGLVAPYVGQTAPMTNKRIDESLDGVLFIDEAYSLVPEKGDDPYGAEAVQILLKRMEDNRDRLVVVLAGYPEPMDRLIKSNPGLSSRFNRYFSFPDYTAPEMGRIFHSMCRKNQYELPVPVRVKLLLGFQYLLDERDEHFGNGRLVRNVFEQAIGRLANRIASVAPLTRELLTTFQPPDIVMDGMPDTVWNDLNLETRRFRLPCPGCKQQITLRQSHLGQRLQCKKCLHKFTADWGEIVSSAGAQ
jgi:AAA+ superfamily predicted ATPase